MCRRCSFQQRPRFVKSKRSTACPEENTGSLLFSDGYGRSGSFEDEKFSQSFPNISRGERRKGVASVTSHNYPFLLRSPLPGKARSTNLSLISANFLDTSRSCVYSTAKHTKQPIAANALNKVNQEELGADTSNPS